MLKCPYCGCPEVEKVEIVDILDQYDEDDLYKYCIAQYIVVCCNCGKHFSCRDTYKVKK